MSNQGKEKVCSESIQKAKRWDREEKKKVSVDTPYVVHKYNTSMGGTDHQDQNVNKYRISIRTKKWWWPLFSWRTDVAIQNVWMLFRENHRRWSLLEFRRYTVRCLLEINGRARYNQDVAIPKRDISKELRLSDKRHLVDDDPSKKACGCKICNLKTQIICTTCKVHLHLKCFSTYHTS